MTAALYGWLCLLTPLVGLAFNLTLGAGFSRRTVGWVASLSILAGFVLSVGALIHLLQQEPSQREHYSHAWHWLSFSGFTLDLSILVDPLSVFMMLIITGVGFLIHAYSVGYMHGDVEERRFFAYLNLFVFSMLVLVLAGNFLILLVGWGLVGLSSYLLIAFWWQRPSAVAAGKKAFVMNAVGDIGIALALFVIFDHVGSLDYQTVFANAGVSIGDSTSTANWIAALLLVGAVAKSAQIPLQTWLPDAMEGPTPVSALIHAATMVTAGVYLVARMWPIYERAPQVHDVVAIIGAATLTMAGLIALVQTDIKRVIAYSTMSQIGYMFCAVGISAYSSGMFHLLTHAFFKALLFLGAGVVIHALSDEQDIRRMGGMSRWMPYTTVVMWIGALSLAGMPPFSGFFSKDQIIASSLARGGGVGYTVFALAVAGALVTGLYTFRMIFLVFHGEPSQFAAEHAPAHTAHGEGPLSMLWTIGVLAFGSVVVGWLEIPGTSVEAVRTFLEPSVPSIVVPTGHEELIASCVSVGLGLVGILVAYGLYGGRRRNVALVERIKLGSAPLPRIFEEKFGFDIAYDYAFYRPAAALASIGLRFWEGPVIGGGVSLVSGISRWTSGRLSAGQTGVVRTYAAMFAFGLAVLMVWFIGKGLV
jgi:NADH-quinone oxidoreductase subunit L